MELRQLRYFVTLAQTLSFSEASRRLFISQGTLSQQIGQLENELDQRLFERTSRKVKLTDAGKELLPLATRTLEMSLRCSQKMKDMKKELSGTLRIGEAYCFDEYIISTIKEFYRLHPKVKLVVCKKTGSELLSLLREDKLDLVLAFKPTVESDDFTQVNLFSAAPQMVMRKDHPLAGKSRITLDEIRQHGLILPGQSQNARRSFDDFVTVDTSDMDVRMEIDEPEMLFDAVRATGLMGVIAPVGLDYQFRMSPDNANPLVARPIEGLESPMMCCAHYLKKAIPKASRDEFIRILKENVDILAK